MIGVRHTTQVLPSYLLRLQLLQHQQRAEDAEALIAAAKYTQIHVRVFVCIELLMMSHLYRFLIFSLSRTAHYPSGPQVAYLYK